MTGVTRWNKSKTLAGADGWNLTPDIGTALDTANVIVPVSSDAERDGLTPPGGKYAGMAVSRTDLPGSPLQIWNGSRWSWFRRLGKNRQVSVTVATASYATLCTVTGTTLGGVCEISYTGVLSNADSGAQRSADVQILQDGTPVGGAVTFALPLVLPTPNDSPMAVCFSFDVTPSPGAHTWALQTRGSLAGAVRNQEMTLTVTEQP